MKGIYLVTSQGMYERTPLEWAIRQAAEAGVSYVQLRENQLPTQEFYQLAQTIGNLLAPYQIPLLINDRLDIALAVGAQGVHLEKESFDWQTARRLMGDRALVGVSVHTRQELEQAQSWEVDYLACGPIFPTFSKAYSHPEWGLDRIGLASKDSGIPVVGVGGIGLANIAQVKQAGLPCVAVVSAILDHPKPGEVAHALVTAWQS